MNYSNKYHYIIGGAGLAGLTLAWKLLESGLLEDKKLLVIDKDKKNINDRTWCFWAKPAKWLEELPISNSWNSAQVVGTDFDFQQDLNPYHYCKIEGIDYYNFILDKLKKTEQIQIAHEVIISENTENKSVKTESSLYEYSEYFFKSYFIADELSKIQNPNKHFIWQHFMGWKIESESDHFNPDMLTYMDMRVPPVRSGLSFGYILPENKKEALVEYTLFSAALWTREEYELALKNYIENILKITAYTVKEEEFGKIPMTNSIFAERKGNSIPIGTLAGTVKPSTGYSFVRNYNHIQQIVSSLKSKSFKFELPNSQRFRFYDEVLMNVLVSEKSSGHDVFGRLYKGNSLTKLMKFLNEDTSIIEDIRIMNTVPKSAFIKAVLEEI